MVSPYYMYFLLNIFMSAKQAIYNGFNGPSIFQRIPNAIDPILEPERDIKFLLFTRDNLEEPDTLSVSDISCLEDSHFNPDDPTKVLIHGWTDFGYTLWLQEAKKNYLSTGSYNVIIVDWSGGSFRDYLAAVRLTKQVGTYLAQLLGFLEREGDLNYDDVHLLGHSLGAHIAGITGYRLSGKVGRITGMDPARPDFEAPLLKDAKDRLDPTDAKFVDVIHTCAGTVGFSRPIGHVDFYPNGGSFRQPGCPFLLTQYCSHGRSNEFVIESILYPRGFPAVECDSWKDFKSKRCEDNVLAYMGEGTDNSTRGIFYLDTNAESPYGKGDVEFGYWK